MPRLGFVAFALLLAGCASTREPIVSADYLDVTLTGGVLAVPDYAVVLKTDDGPAFQDMFPEADNAEKAYQMLVDSVLAARWAGQITADRVVRTGPPEPFGPTRRVSVGLRAGSETDSVYVSVPPSGVVLEYEASTPDFVLIVGRWTATEDVQMSFGTHAGPNGFMPTASSDRYLGNEVGYVLWDNRTGQIIQRNVVAAATTTSLFRGARADWSKSIEAAIDALLADVPWEAKVDA